MKAFRLIGIAIMAILISVNFASCSSDDDEEETNSEYKALLGSWQMSEQDGDILVTSSFIFNSNGTYSFTYAENGDSDEVYTGKFTYDANSHKITRYEGNSNIIYEEIVEKCDESMFSSVLSISIGSPTLPVLNIVLFLNLNMFGE